MVNDGGYGHFWLCIILFEVPYFLSIFPLKTWERAPPIFYRKSPWDGVEYHRVFLKNLTMLAAIATRSFGVGCIRHIFGRMKATMTTWPKPETAHETLCHPGQDYVRVGTIPYFSFISGISCQYWEGAWLLEGIDDADKKWGGLFLSRQDSESLSHNHHRWFSPSRWRTEKENFLFPD